MSEQIDSSFDDSPETSSDQNNAIVPPPRRQFSMKTLFGLSLVFVFACSAMATVNYISGLPAVLTIMFLVVIFSIPAILTTAALYSRGYRRTFFIGTMFPGIGGIFVSYVLLGLIYDEDNPGTIVVMLIGWLLVVVVSGTACIITRWLVETKTEVN